MNKKKIKSGWDIMQLGNVINEKFPEFSGFQCMEIDFAMEDLFTVQKEIQRIASELKDLQQGDYENFSQLMCDLKFTLEHSKGHIQEAEPMIDKLWNAVSEKADLTQMVDKKHQKKK